MDMNELLKRPADEFGNDESLEEIWATKAFEHAEVHFNLLCSVDPKFLHLTPIDETIYTIFRQDFPKLDVKVVNENKMKSPEGKIKWRNFCDRFKHILDDYNFGTLLRANSHEGYTQENSILVPRVQFLAIELSRNKEGYNNILRNKFKPPPKEEKAELIAT